jgi:transcriptional regulator with XRE-family HTH domain
MIARGKNYSKLPMKQIPCKIGLRLRALRQSRKQTQASLAKECRQRGFAVTREKLAKYEIGLTQVPACLIPIIAHVLKADITDLLPPVGREDRPNSKTAPMRARNLSGKKIQFYRKKRKWTQRQLASVLRTMGISTTRETIANVESQRTRVRDYQLVYFAKALQIPLESLLPDFADYTKTFSVHHLRKTCSRPAT